MGLSVNNSVCKAKQKREGAVAILNATGQEEQEGNMFFVSEIGR